MASINYYTLNVFLSPVMLTKEPSVHLSIFVSQSFGWPERKALQFGPNQRMGVTLHRAKADIRNILLKIYVLLQNSYTLNL